jgi:threonyl-tRNA synthetase
MTPDKILKQIDKISQRIFELNQKVDVTISTSELNKIQKVKKKLLKDKQKLYNKLYPPDEADFVSDNPDLETD